MQKFSVICCSALRRELETILQKEYPHIRTVFLDSMLHMHPERLHHVMDATLETLGSQPCLLVYGDCHPYMHDIEQRSHCCRTRVLNCAELLLGKELYKCYRLDKAFFFLPEWTLRWREVFQQELGFADPELAQEFMQETRAKLVFLDTGLIAVPRKALQEIAEFFNMPVEVLPVSLDPMRRAIDTALAKFSALRSNP